MKRVRTGAGMGLGVGLLTVLAACGGGTGSQAAGGGRLSVTPAAAVASDARLVPPAGAAGRAPLASATLLAPVAVATPPAAAAVPTPARAPAPAPATAPATAHAPVAPPAPVTAAAPADTAVAASALAAGTVEGRVGRGGQPAVGARVVLVAADGTERTSVTDGDGNYRFVAVPAGSYQLMVTAESGRTCDDRGCISASWMERADLTVAGGATSRLDVGD